MYKCTNCEYQGDKLSEKPLKDKCPSCGDEVKSLGETPEINLDLNNDGKVDSKDASIASKVMNSIKKKKKSNKKGKRK